MEAVDRTGFLAFQHAALNARPIGLCGEGEQKHDGQRQLQN
jgi:hypothetical protein